MRNYKNEIHAVRLPRYKIISNRIVSYQNWGEVAAEEFAGFLNLEKELSEEEIRMYSILWNTLREDNSPLRAAVNGKILGVPESFYDFLIPSLYKDTHASNHDIFVFCGVILNRRTSSTPQSSALQNTKISMVEVAESKREGMEAAYQRTDKRGKADR